MTRKSFLKQATIVLGSSAILKLPNDILQTDPAPMSVPLVKEFVTAGHSDLEKVKSMLVDHPNLIYTKYDWGKGDYESAIEGAGHLGKRDIAEYLIEKGARVNLFILTMLGKTAIVKATIEAYPNLLYGLGAHGFTLFHHAEVGGEAALELKEYFVSKGMDKKIIPLK